MRSRIRIKKAMSPYFRKEIVEPGIKMEYEHGFKEMILLNKAFAIMLSEEKIISMAEKKTIVEALQYVEDHFTAVDIDGQYEELYFNMEQMFMQKAGVHIGGKLHTGRSRNDIYATLWRMEARKSVWQMMKSIIALQEQMLVLAKEYKDVVITGYTHMQPAQPITVGYYYLAAVEVLSRDFARLQDAYCRLNKSPYGAAALAGTGFAINRMRLQSLLGFEGIVENGLDCVGSRDYLLEIQSAYAIMMVNVSRIVQDHYIWCTSEFGVLQIGGEVAVCSSIMPQKKNPVALELAKAKGAHSIGSLMSSFSVLKNTPFSLCMDLFEAHGQYWSGWEATKQSVELLTETLRYAAFDCELAYKRTKGNFSTVTALADFLVKKFNVSFSEAHDVVAQMVGTVIENQESIDCLTPQLLQESAKALLDREFIVAAAELAAVLEPLANVQSKQSRGGPGETSVKKMLADASELIIEESRWLDGKINQVEQGYREILQNS